MRSSAQKMTLGRKKLWDFGFETQVHCLLTRWCWPFHLSKPNVIIIFQTSLKLLFSYFCLVITWLLITAGGRLSSCHCVEALITHVTQSPKQVNVYIVTGSPPSSSIHGILQARILEWVAISFSRGSSRPRDRTQVSHIHASIHQICSLFKLTKTYNEYLISPYIKTPHFVLL